MTELCKKNNYLQPEAQIGKKLRSFPTKGKKKSEIVQLEDYEGKKAQVEGGED